jgi:hypothetical protein
MKMQHLPKTFFLITILISLLVPPGAIPNAESANLKSAARHAAKAKGPRNSNYDEVIPFVGNLRYAKAKRNGKWGLIDREADKELIAPKYEDISGFEANYHSVTIKLNGKWGCIDYPSGKIIIPLKYDELDHFGNGPRRAKLNGKWGYLDLRTGKEFIPLKYDEIGSFFSTALPLSTNYIEKTPEFRKALTEYEEVKYVTGITAAVRRNNKWGFIGRDGKEFVAPKYHGAGEFVNGAAIVTRNNLSGFIDETGREIVRPAYGEARPFSEGLAAIGVKSSDKRFLYGYVDKTGKVIVNPKYESAGDFHDGRALVSAHGEKFYIDPTGKELHLPGYNDLSHFSEGLAAVQAYDPQTQISKWGFIDTTGKEVIPPQYGGFFSFAKGFANVKLPGQEKWFYIDKSGRPWASAGLLPWGLARVRLNGKWGYIDGEGREIIPIKYDELPVNLIRRFNRFKLNGKYGYFDGAANEISPAKYDDAPEKLFDGNERTVRVSANGKYGYLSKNNGKEIYPPKCEDGPAFLEILKTKVKCDGKWGYIDQQGREVSTFEYEDDPSAFEKTKGDHYVFGLGTGLKAQPEVGSAGIAQLPAGTKIEVLSKTDKELTIGDVSDKWYEASYEGKRGYVWGGSIADSGCPASIKGKNAVVVIRNRTNYSDHSYHPKFEMQLVIDGKVVDNRLDSKLSNITATVRSMKFESHEGFSAPLNLLVLTVDESHGRDQGSNSIVSAIYYYLDDGKLADVLHVKLAVEGEGRKVTSTVILPDKNGEKDVVTVRSKVSTSTHGDRFYEERYEWDWNSKTFKH